MPYDPDEEYFCTTCGYNHRAGSKTHKPHWIHREGAGNEEENEEDEEMEDEENESETLTRKEIRQAYTDIDDEVKRVSLDDIDGVSSEVARKLKTVGVLKPADLAEMNPQALVDTLKNQGVKGIGEKTAEKLIASAQEACGGGVRTAKQMILTYRRRIQPRNLITSGSKELDEKIGGGWILGSTIEAYGQGASGKSELALQMAVNAFLPAGKGGLVRDGFIPQVLIIDTEGVMDMAVSRFPSMCTYISEIFGHTESESEVFFDMVTDNIDIQQAYSSAVQQTKMDKAYEDVLNERKNYVIVIIDSLVNNFRADYPKLNDLAPRQKAINIFLKRAKDTITIARTPEDLGGILFCTNQAQSKPTIYGDGLTNIGGNVVQHNLDLRLKCKRPSESKPQRIAKIVDASWLPTGDATFSIFSTGVASEDGESSIKKMLEAQT